MRAFYYTEISQSMSWPGPVATRFWPKLGTVGISTAGNVKTSHQETADQQHDEKQAQSKAKHGE
jgi:hypothetical protein